MLIILTLPDAILTLVSTPHRDTALEGHCMLTCFLFFHRLDDIAIVGEDQFYFTNFFYLNMDLEVLLGLHWGSIGFYDGTAGTLLVTELLVPNGIVLSSDNKSVA